ncbi:MAG: FtsW/RodA/SpoVE family cell cycle protein [Bergeyella zoohelcum]|nr:FtsW/RodA/SpoVE family cell cycle protein [Bergeyella zoohelcum]
MVKNTKSIEIFRGDKILWILVIIISVFSLFAVYSASTNLQYIVGNGTAIGHLGKHFVYMVVGLGIMRMFSGGISFRVVGKISSWLLPLMILALVYAIIQGKTIDGTSAGRWIDLKVFSFQPSVLAYLVLVIYLCRFLAKTMVEKEQTIWEIILKVFLPITVVFGLVFIENGSTGAIILLVSTLVLLMGQLKLKYIGGFILTMLIGITVFIIVAKTTDWIPKNRVDTWEKRVERFLGKEEPSKVNDVNEAFLRGDYQSAHAKLAIVHGGMMGVGAGKSALKSRLPQSASDFIFAIIVEEWGLVGGVALICMYFIVFMRIITIAHKTPSLFGALLVISIGWMIFIQLATNVLVAVGAMPVTGQPLPLVSLGGSALWVTYIQLGIVLNVSAGTPLRDEEGNSQKPSIEEMNDIA